MFSPSLAGEGGNGGMSLKQKTSSGDEVYFYYRFTTVIVFTLSPFQFIPIRSRKSGGLMISHQTLRLFILELSLDIKLGVIIYF